MRKPRLRENGPLGQGHGACQGQSWGSCACGALGLSSTQSIQRSLLETLQTGNNTCIHTHARMHSPDLSSPQAYLAPSQTPTRFLRSGVFKLIFRWSLLFKKLNIEILVCKSHCASSPSPGGLPHLSSVTPPWPVLTGLKPSIFGA